LPGADPDRGSFCSSSEAVSTAAPPEGCHPAAAGGAPFSPRDLQYRAVWTAPSAPRCGGSVRKLPASGGGDSGGGFSAESLASVPCAAASSPGSLMKKSPLAHRDLVAKMVKETRSAYWEL